MKSFLSHEGCIYKKRKEKCISTCCLCIDISIVAVRELLDSCRCLRHHFIIIGDQIEVFKILNGYENIDSNIFSHSRKIIELEDTR